MTLKDYQYFVILLHFQNYRLSSILIQFQKYGYVCISLNHENRLHVFIIFYELYFKRYGHLKTIDMYGVDAFPKLRLYINIVSISEIWVYMNIY